MKMARYYLVIRAVFIAGEHVRVISETGSVSWFMMDWKSKAGTFLNREKLEPYKPTGFLKSGDIIGLGCQDNRSAIDFFNSKILRSILIVSKPIKIVAKLNSNFNLS